MDNNNIVACDCNFFIKREDNWQPHYNTCRTVLIKRTIEKNYKKNPRNPDGTLNIQNQYLKTLDQDVLYHLALGTKSHDLRQLFGDIKFVCMGGTAHRMEELAQMAIKKLKIKIPDGCDIIDMTAPSHRYSLYKVGPLICVNHGIGMSSLSVVLQEIIKLLQYSKTRDPIIFRIGTSGGIGVQPGTVVVSNKGYNGLLKETYDLAVLGKMVEYPVVLDQRLAEEIKSFSKATDDFQTVTGGTLGAEDFYNGQGRIDGPFCDHSEADKNAFLEILQQKGIKNIEMEIPCFGYMTYAAGIKAADVCVTIVNRFHGDQVTSDKPTLLKLQKHPMIIVLRFMKQYLKAIKKYPYGYAQ